MSFTKGCFVFRAGALALLCCGAIEANQAKLCPRPGTPKNGVFCLKNSQSECVSSPPFYAGTSVSYECRTGFNLIPSSSKTIQCLDDETWSADTPVCEKRIQSSDWHTANVTIRLLEDDRVADIRERFRCSDQYSRFQLKLNSHLSKRNSIYVKMEMCSGSTDEVKLSFKSEGKDRVHNCSQLNSAFPVNTYKCQLPEGRTEPLDFIAIDAPKDGARFKNAVFILPDEDYCGEPPVPVNGTVEKITDHQYRYRCEELKLIGEELTTCDPSTGRWSSMPICSPPGLLDWENQMTRIIAVSVGALLISVIILTCYCCKVRRSKNGRRTGSSKNGPLLP